MSIVVIVDQEEEEPDAFISQDSIYCGGASEFEAEPEPDQFDILHATYFDVAVLQVPDIQSVIT